MRLALVINRSAGSFRRLPLEPTVEAIAAIFRRHGHDLAVTVCGKRDLPAALAQWVRRDDIDAIIIGGGDGTFLTAILAGLGNDKPVGLLPLGTLNLLARDLGLPIDPLAASQALASSRVAEIDLAEVNGLPFAIWASLGMHPRVVRRRDKLQAEGLSKWRAFALAALRALRRYPLMQVDITIDGHTTSMTTPIVVISNNAWAETPLPLPPSRASLDRGELMVHVAKTTSRGGLLWLALNALVGRWRVNRLLEIFSAEQVVVTGRKSRMMLSLDGEVTVLRAPLVFRSHPKSLRVLVPEATPCA
ncbi:MAG: sphingosine kinase and enzyme related to diacylglycerol [Rhodospirillaceae bacterium]|nr:MAG: sphingosine kinase and enzyme related to diacylglycerol [Rhodospirillaceae bacterium]TNC97779.1 MAG: sphingosine kinase and enzyme related to diacylglycerol kinase [Stygiobacter sp.]